MCFHLSAKVDHFQDEAKKYASHEEGLVAQKASLEAEASRSSKSREKLVALERKRVELEMSTRYGSSVKFHCGGDSCSCRKAG
ncbi:hypothetical protein Bca4012_092300 [Brassica carinata]